MNILMIGKTVLTWNIFLRGLVGRLPFFLHCFATLRYCIFLKNNLGIPRTGFSLQSTKVTHSMMLSFMLLFLPPSLLPCLFLCLLPYLPPFLSSLSDGLLYFNHCIGLGKHCITKALWDFVIYVVWLIARVSQSIIKILDRYHDYFNL